MIMYTRMLSHTVSGSTSMVFDESIFVFAVNLGGPAVLRPSRTTGANGCVDQSVRKVSKIESTDRPNR